MHIYSDYFNVLINSFFLMKQVKLHTCLLYLKSVKFVFPTTNQVTVKPKALPITTNVTNGNDKDPKIELLCLIEDLPSCITLNQHTLPMLSTRTYF